MILKYTIGLSLLLASSAFSQTILWEENFNSIVFATNSGQVGAFSSVGRTSAGNTPLNTAETNARGIFSNNITQFFNHASDTKWQPSDNVTLPNRSTVFSTNGGALAQTFQTVTLQAGYEMTFSFKMNGVFSTINSTHTPSFNGVDFVGTPITFVDAHQRQYSFTGTWKNNTASAITAPLIITSSNADNRTYDDFLDTVPEPSAALLGEFGALARLRRGR